MLERLAYLSGGVVIVVTLILAYQNRASLDIIRATSVIVAGVAVSLLTMLSFFRDEVERSVFTTSIIIDDQTGAPAHLRILVDDTLMEHEAVIMRMLDAGRMIRIAASENDPIGFSEDDDREYSPALNNAYQQLNVYLILESIKRAFPFHWATPLDPSYPVPGVRNHSVSFGDPSGSTKRDSAGTRIVEARVKELAANPITSVNWTGDLNLPPKAELRVSPFEGKIEIRTPFVVWDVQVRNASPVALSSADVLLRRLGVPQGRSYSMMLSEVVMSRRVVGVRKGHPELDKYRQWMTKLEEAVRERLEDGTFWTAAASVEPDSALGGVQHAGSPPTATEGHSVRVEGVTVGVVYEDDNAKITAGLVGELHLRLARAGFEVEPSSTWAESAEEDDEETGPLLAVLQPALTVTLVVPDARRDSTDIAHGLVRRNLEEVLSGHGYSVEVWTWTSLSERLNGAINAMAKESNDGDLVAVLIGRRIGL